MFDAQGDGPARYNIIHFKQVKAGQFRWLRVGEYSDGALNLNMSGEQQGGEQLTIPRGGEKERVTSVAGNTQFSRQSNIVTM